MHQASKRIRMSSETLQEGSGPLLTSTEEGTVKELDEALPYEVIELVFDRWILFSALLPQQA